MSIISNPDTLWGIFVIFLLIWFGSGAGFKVVGKILKNWTNSRPAG